MINNSSIINLLHQRYTINKKRDFLTKVPFYPINKQLQKIKNDYLNFTCSPFLYLAPLASVNLGLTILFIYFSKASLVLKSPSK